MCIAAVEFFYGLAIQQTCERSTTGTNIDVSWKNRQSSLSRYDGLGPIRAFVRGAEQWTRHLFAAGSTTYAVFDVSPDGHRVHSWASSEVEPENLKGLFLETVMRTVLCRLGFPAVHAAALEKNGKAVLLLGHKGAGKSTLAASLQTNDWRLVADDLVRLRPDGKEWCALPGMQRSKLLPDSMRALNHIPEDAERRWKGEMPAGVADDAVAKLLLHASEPIDPAAAFPVMAVLCLAPRQAGDEPVVESLTPLEAVLSFSEHLIRDPLPPHSPPAPAGTMVGDIARQSLVWRVVLPNNLQRLQESALWLDHFLMNQATPASALSEAQ